MKQHTTQVILVQFKDVRGEYSYRIAKLIGATTVKHSSGKNTWHVGDVLTEAQADDVSASRDCEVTVTEKHGR